MCIYREKNMVAPIFRLKTSYSEPDNVDAFVSRGQNVLLT